MARFDGTRSLLRWDAGLLLLLAVWGGLVPFVGPSFHYTMGSARAWTWSESVATVHVVPAVVAVLGGLLLLLSRSRGVQISGAALGTLAGMWFVVGPTLHSLWASSGSGMMMGGSKLRTAFENLGYHYGTGVLIAVLGAIALGFLLAARTAPDAVAAGAGVSRTPRGDLVDA